MPLSGALPSIQNHLGTAKKCQRLARLPVTDYGIPDLGGSAEVDGGGGAVNDAVPGGAQMVGFELNGGEPARAFRQIGNAAIASRGVGKSHHAARMQKTIGRHQGSGDGHLRPDFFCADIGDDDPEKARKIPSAEFVEIVWVVHGQLCVDRVEGRQRVAQVRRNFE